jgi:hypothetical protein
LEALPASVNHASKLYLLEEAWEEKWMLREGSGGGSGSSSRGGGCGGHGANRGQPRKWRERSRLQRIISARSGKVGHDRCCKSGKKEHWAHDCWSKSKKETTYTVQEEESLMLVAASPQVKIGPQSGMVQAVAVVAQEDGEVGIGGAVAHIVRLREERVFAHLGEEEHDCKSWICDTGATNHMLGSRAAFAELDMWCEALSVLAMIQ